MLRRMWLPPVVLTVRRTWFCSCYETALKLKPTFPEALNNLGVSSAMVLRVCYALPGDLHYDVLSRRCAFLLQRGAPGTHQYQNMRDQTKEKGALTWQNMRNRFPGAAYVCGGVYEPWK
eukprot:1479343-Rhodomonas_salina.2